MTKRSTDWPIKVPAGTTKVGTARVREDRTVGRGFAERELMRRMGNAPHSTFDEIADGVAEKGFTTLADALGMDQQQVDAVNAKREADAPLIAALLRKPETPREAAKKALQALGRLKVGAMNKTETAYEKNLAALKHAGEIAWYRFEGVKLRLADNTFYTPDFAVMLAGGEMECHEVKGHWQDDARAKIKIAADQYPFKFIAVTAKTKKSGGGWAVEEF